jgi:hypothetical protein
VLYRRESVVPGTTITIDSHQRDGLYELVRNHLGSVGELFDALERDRDFAKAERLGLEFAEDFQLLRDIGWGEREKRSQFELTMTSHDLMELLHRLHGEAIEVIVGSGGEAQSIREDEKTDQRFQLGCEACNTLLAELDPRRGGSA